MLGVAITNIDLKHRTDIVKLQVIRDWPQNE